MDNRIAIVGIIVEDIRKSEEVNEVLHEYSQYILGRMGLPKVEKDINIISIVMKADPDIISAMTGKIGMISEVSCKAVYSKA